MDAGVVMREAAAAEMNPKGQNAVTHWKERGTVATKMKIVMMMRKG